MSQCSGIPEEWKYSVLMCVYAGDHAEFLKTAIESILKQTYRPDQFVIVQDGPVPDHIHAVLEEYTLACPGLFTLIQNRENMGLAAALNTGLEHCRNDLVARMDADDISLPDRCEKELRQFMQTKELAVCGCNMGEFYEESDRIETLRIVPAHYEDILKFMRTRQPFNHPAVMYRKSRVMACGGYRQLRRKEDFDLFSRMLLNGCYAINLTEVLYLYRADSKNYKRRKSFLNLKCAFHVYWSHYRRKGCSFWDFIVICSGELLFFLVPLPFMIWLSDTFLRKKHED